MIYFLTASSIETKLLDGEREIDLMPYQNFKWEHVYVFGPHTTEEMIEESSEIKFSFIYKKMEISEMEFLLIFEHKHKPAKMFALSKKYGDYQIADNRYLIVKDNY